jgi:hypothetical protein
MEFGFYDSLRGAVLWSLGLLKCLDSSDLTEIGLFLPSIGDTTPLRTMEPSDTELCSLSFPSLSTLRITCSIMQEAVHLLRYFNHSEIKELEFHSHDHEEFSVTSEFTSYLAETFSHFQPHTFKLKAQMSPPEVVPCILGSMNLTFLEDLTLDLFGKCTPAMISTLSNQEYTTPGLREIYLHGSSIAPLIGFLTRLRACQSISEVMSVKVYSESGHNNEDLKTRTASLIRSLNLSEGTVIPFTSLHTMTLELTLDDPDQILATMKFFSRLAPDVANLTYNIKPILWKDSYNTKFSDYYAALDIQKGGSLPFPLVSRLEGKVPLDQEYEEERLRETILKLLMRRSEAGAVALE